VWRDILTSGAWSVSPVTTSAEDGVISVETLLESNKPANPPAPQPQMTSNQKQVISWI